MEIFSNLSAETISIDDSMFKEVKDELLNSLNYDELLFNDLIYTLEDMRRTLKYIGSKRKFFLKVIPLANTLTFEEIIALKPFEYLELTRLK